MLILKVWGFVPKERCHRIGSSCIPWLFLDFEVWPGVCCCFRVCYSNRDLRSLNHLSSMHPWMHWILKWRVYDFGIHHHECRPPSMDADDFCVTVGAPAARSEANNELPENIGKVADLTFNLLSLQVLCCEQPIASFRFILPISCFEKFRIHSVMLAHSIVVWASIWLNQDHIKVLPPSQNDCPQFCWYFWANSLIMLWKTYLRKVPNFYINRINEEHCMCSLQPKLN